MSVRIANPATSLGIFALPCLLAAVLLMLMLPMDASAGDTRIGVKAKHGEMVLLRSVPTRVATRQQPPGAALIVDPRPNQQLDATLGIGTELSDSEIAGMGASPLNTVTHSVNGSMTRMLGTTSRSTGNTGGRSISPDNTAPGSSPMGSAMGSLGSATRGVGHQVRQALSALPLPTQGNDHR